MLPSPCLLQVAGLKFKDPKEQIASCVSLFGFPVVPTITIPADPVYSTEVTTSTYIDISISTSVQYSTVESVSTSYEYVSKTTTEYTTTIVNTIVATHPAI